MVTLEHVMIHLELPSPHTIYLTDESLNASQCKSMAPTINISSAQDCGAFRSSSSSRFQRWYTIY